MRIEKVAALCSFQLLSGASGPDTGDFKNESPARRIPRAEALSLLLLLLPLLLLLEELLSPPPPPPPPPPLLLLLLLLLLLSLSLVVVAPPTVGDEDDIERDASVLLEASVPSSRSSEEGDASNSGIFSVC